MEPPFQHQACQWQVATQARVFLPTNVAMASLKTLSASFRAYCGVYLNQINFTGRLNFRRRHRKVWISISTKERGFQKRITRPLRADFRQCEYNEKLWRENQTRHEGSKLPNKRRQYGAIQKTRCSVQILI